MSTIKVNEGQKKALAITMALALLFLAYFLKPYFTIIVFAGIIAFIYGPFYDRQFAKTNNSGKSLRRTLLFIIASLVIPLTMVIYVSYLQINQIVTDTDFSRLSQSTSSLVNNTNDILSRMHVDFRLDSAHLQTGAEK
jgi:predicted PurR-regulated permease PerM